MLEWNCGDSFDLALLLTCFLLGAGYDAYVVLGTAPKHVTLRDQVSLLIRTSTSPSATRSLDTQHGHQTLDSHWTLLDAQQGH